MSKKYKTAPDGRKYRFSHDKFMRTGNKYRMTHKIESKSITWENIMYELSSDIGYNYNTIKGWKSGKHNPSDFNAILGMASYFDVNWCELVDLEQREEVVCMNHEVANYSESENELIKSIYRGILNYRYSSIDYYERIPGHPGASRSDIDRYQKESLRRMHREIDDSFLEISEATRQKLHRLLIEVEEEKNSTYGDILPARWLRHNKWLEWAKIYYMIESGDDQFVEDVLHDSEDGDIEKVLYSRIEEGIEARKSYCVSHEAYNCCLFADRGCADQLVKKLAKKGRKDCVEKYDGTEQAIDGKYSMVRFVVKPGRHKHVFANKEEAEKYLAEMFFEIISEKVECDQNAANEVEYYLWENDFEEKTFLTQNEALRYLYSKYGENTDIYCVNYDVTSGARFANKETAVEYAERFGLCEDDISVKYEEAIQNAEIDEIDIFRHEYTTTLQSILREDFSQIFSRQ